MTELAPRAVMSKRLKYVVALRRSRFDGDQDRPYIGLENIESSTGRLVGDPGAADQSTPSQPREGESLSSTFEPGDVLFGKLRPYLAKAWVAAFPGRCTTELLVMQPVDIEPRFLRYVCLSRDFIDAVDASTFGSKMPRADWDFIGNMVVAVPPIQQQRAIADYLDRETARLDELVAAKERVLGLLAEKRRALITRAVTRGLNPGARLKDSGISWLGEIPAHWERVQLKRFVQFVTSGSRGWAEHYSNAGAIFLRIGNLTRDSVRLDLSDIQYVDPPEGAEGERTRVQVGDLLFSITAYLGSIAFVDRSIGDAYVNQHIALVRLHHSGRFVPEYAAYFALSDPGQTQLVAQSYGGTKTQLALEDIRELWFPVPPVTEQTRIVEYVNSELPTLDRLQSAARDTILLLKERRSTLITAAVSGQMDMGRAA